MTPRYAPPCPHRCCVDDDLHEHEQGAATCTECAAVADVHPLARRALGIAAKHDTKQPEETQ